MTRRYQLVVNGRTYTVDNAVRVGAQVNFSLDGENYRVSIDSQANSASNNIRAQHKVSSSVDNNQIVSPLPGIVVSLAISIGDNVARGQTVCVIEAMKMENNITAPRDGVIESIEIAVGQEVGNRQVLVRLREV